MRVMRADADEPDIIFADVLRDARLVHRLRVAVDQHDFMAGRRERLEEKHPQVRHEIFRNAIVGTIEQYFHRFNLLRRHAGQAGSDDLRRSSIISFCRFKNRRPYGHGGRIEANVRSLSLYGTKNDKLFGIRPFSLTRPNAPPRRRDFLS